MHVLHTAHLLNTWSISLFQYIHNFTDLVIDLSDEIRIGSMLTMITNPITVWLQGIFWQKVTTWAFWTLNC